MCAEMSFSHIFLCTVLRHNDNGPQAKTGRLKDSYDDDPELTAQLHQTLADFEADLAGEGARHGPQCTHNLKLDSYFFIEASW